ncbi:MAG: hypothetical protein P4N41_20790 [Negativicutes bacterium]|nr:hypothetical protein [Negativicutes bacterium]
MPVYTTELTIAPDAVIREMGYKAGAEVDARIMQEITAVIREVKPMLQPGVAYAEYPADTDALAGGFVLPAGALAPGPHIFSCLSQSESLVAAVATVGGLGPSGPGPDDLFAAFLRDAVGTVALYELQDSFWRWQASQAADKGGGITALFFPGEGEWGLEDQGVLVANVDAAAIGVTVNRGFLLTPLKSVAMLFGVGGRIKTPRAGHECSACSRVTCPRRR